jgi:hypothetical protein
MNLEADLTPVSYRRQEREVGLIDLGGIDWRVTFFSRAVHAAIDLGRDPIAVPIDEWIQAENEEADPIAFVFHVGRCGSSVIVNMLNARPDVLVISEPQLMNGLTRELLAGGSQELLRVALRRMVAAASHKSVVIKTTSWTIAAAKQIARIFPSARMLFISRDAEAVVKSCLREPPAWSPMQSSPPIELFPDLEANRTESSEFFLAAWRAAMKFAEQLPSDRTLHIDYDTIANDPSTAALQLLRHLGLPENEASIASMLKTTLRHSKRADTAWSPAATSD